MLGKLMKYEWKATWKLLAAAYVFMLVMTIIARLMVKILDSSHFGELAMLELMAVLVLIAYVGSMFAVNIGAGIFLIHRFYTSTYGDQGYLLHTLPVDTHHIIIAKVLVTTAWEMLNIVSSLFSVLFIFASSREFLKDMMEGIRNTIELLSGQKITAFTVIMTLVAFVFAFFARVLKVGACISLGQLSANHKLLMSFAWYVAIYVVGQIFQVVYFVIMLIFLRQKDPVDYFSYFNHQWETTLIGGIISCVVFYLLTWYVMSRKLNLE